MKCKQCLKEKENNDFLTYNRCNGVLCSYKICKECYSAKHRLRMLGTHPSLETIEKMAASRRGVKQSPEHIEKRVSHFRGRIYSSEHRKKISVANTGYKHTDEAKQKMSLLKTGLKHTGEHCLKISASNVGKHNGKRSEKQRVNISIGTKKGMSPVEVRQMCADRQRRLLASNIYKTPKTTELNMKKILVENLGLIEGKDFKHQYYVELEHPHVADFFIYKINTVVECDGDYWHSLPKNIAKDKIHEKEMDEASISWIRFTETDIVKNKNKVINILLNKLEENIYG